MRSITDVIGQFKQNWTRQLGEEGIAEACRETGMTWIDSALNPIITVQIFFLQILHGTRPVNTCRGNRSRGGQ